MLRRCCALEVTGNLDIPQEHIDAGEEYTFADSQDFWTTKEGEGEACDGRWVSPEQTCELIVRPHNSQTVYGLLEVIKTEHETFGSISEETMAAVTAVIEANK